MGIEPTSGNASAGASTYLACNSFSPPGPLQASGRKASPVLSRLQIPRAGFPKAILLSDVLSVPQEKTQRTLAGLSSESVVIVVGDYVFLPVLRGDRPRYASLSVYPSRRNRSPPFAHYTVIMKKKQNKGEKIPLYPPLKKGEVAIRDCFVAPCGDSSQ